MSIIQAVLLGALQGVAEFLPISSSGHLILARALMGVSDVPALFDVMLHLATLLVVIFVFRRRIGELLAAGLRILTRRAQDGDRAQGVLVLQLIAATFLTAVLGLGISTLEFRESPQVVCGLFLVTAAILITTRGLGGRRGLNEAGWGRTLAVGGAQGLGVFAGISRSGITIGTALICGMDRKAAGELSFLLSLPAVAGAFLLTVKDAAELGAVVPMGSLIAGLLTTVAVGYASLKILLWLISEGRLWFFSFYLIPVGIWGLFYFR